MWLLHCSSDLENMGPYGLVSLSVPDLEFNLSRLQLRYGIKLRLLVPM